MKTAGLFLVVFLRNWKNVYNAEFKGCVKFEYLINIYFLTSVQNTIISNIYSLMSTSQKSPNTQTENKKQQKTIYNVIMMLKTVKLIYN